MKDLDIKAIPVLLKKLQKILQRYSVIIFILTILGIYGFLVFQIRQLSVAEPDQDQVTEQLKTTPRIKIDEESIAKIKQLEDQNVGVQALFKSARDNPFEDKK
jgi:hypothetical protein